MTLSSLVKLSVRGFVLKVEDRFSSRGVQILETLICYWAIALQSFFINSFSIVRYVPTLVKW